MSLPPYLGWPVLVVAWTLAAIGIFFEWRGERQSVLLYIVMGWMSVLLIYPLARTVDLEGLMYLIAGGAFYTAGSILVQAAPVPRNHELWHVLVLAGSACHFVFMLNHLP